MAGSDRCHNADDYRAKAEGRETGRVITVADIGPSRLASRVVSRGNVQEIAELNMTVHLIHSWPGHAKHCGGNWPEFSCHRYVAGFWVIQFGWTWFGTRHWIQIELFGSSTPTCDSLDRILRED